MKRFVAPLLAFLAAVTPVAAQEPAAAPATVPLQGNAPLIPPEFKGVEIVEHVGAKLPLSLPFVDETGTNVTLGDYFKADRPVLLTLNYYECPMLCNLVLAGLVDGLKTLDWTPGKEFEVVTVSINHREGPAVALAKKNSHVEAIGKPEAASGWHFLTGKTESIKALTETVGFGYRWDPDQMQYVHGAAIFMVAPDGTLTRYLYGIQYPARDLRLALVEAGEGKLGSVVDKFMLYCFHYVPSSQKYEFYIWGAMRLGGLLTVLAVGTLLGVLWARERRAMRAEAGGVPPHDHAVTRV